MVRHLLCLLFVPLVLPLSGCSKGPPPKTLPSHFEGIVGSPLGGEVEYLSMDLKQDGANLTGTYVYSRNGTLREVKGDLSGTTGGDEVHLQLTTSAEAQKTLGWSATLPLNGKLGEVPREVAMRALSSPDRPLPPAAKEDTGPVTTLTGAVQLGTTEGTTTPKPVLLYDLKLLP